MAVTHEQSIEAAIEECAFAKQVETQSGLALLINGNVITLGCKDSDFWVEAISRALRRGGQDDRGEVYAKSSMGEGM